MLVIQSRAYNGNSCIPTLAHICTHLLVGYLHKIQFTTFVFSAIARENFWRFYNVTGWYLFLKLSNESIIIASYESKQSFRWTAMILMTSEIVSNLKLNCSRIAMYEWCKRDFVQLSMRIKCYSFFIWEHIKLKSCHFFLRKMHWMMLKVSWKGRSKSWWSLYDYIRRRSKVISYGTIGNFKGSDRW